jgi:hypothetical protein
LFGNRIACDTSIPLDATLAVNVRLVSCQRCRKTRIFKKASAMVRPKFEKIPVIQQELFLK